ncbi:MAG: hypothetical protein ABW208_20225 [Pyrinomonadaceae bacterium]
MSSGSPWPSNDGPNALVLTGVSAGIGFFFLRLNHVTRNPAYRRATSQMRSSAYSSPLISRSSMRALSRRGERTGKCEVGGGVG